MEGLRFGSPGNRPKSLRGRFVLLVVLPPAILGLTFLLLQEYVFQSMDPAGAATRLVLRLGGLVLCLLAAILAAACGYLLVDRFNRPLRLLLRLAEDGELPGSRVVGLQNRGPEIHELHRLVSVLVNQNKAGARALEELEQLRMALARLREDVARTGQHGAMPSIRALPEGQLREIGLNLDGKRQQLQAFFRDLRERVGALKGELAAVSESLPGGAQPAPDEPLREPQDSLKGLRELGTVWTLEAARASGSPGPVAARQFDRFQAALGELETQLALLPAETEGREEVLRERLDRLVEHLNTLDRLLGEVEER